MAGIRGRFDIDSSVNVVSESEPDDPLPSEGDDIPVIQDSDNEFETPRRHSTSVSPTSCMSSASNSTISTSVSDDSLLILLRETNSIVKSFEQRISGLEAKLEELKSSNLFLTPGARSKGNASWKRDISDVVRVS